MRGGGAAEGDDPFTGARMKILRARVVVTVEEGDGSVHERELVDWADGGAGATIEMSYTHDRPAHHGYTIGQIAPTSIVTEGHETFALNLRKNRTPRVLVGA
jgi:hypothetical protein